MKILITEFMETKSVELLKNFFDITFDQELSKNHDKLKLSINNFFFNHISSHFYSNWNQFY